MTQLERMFPTSAEAAGIEADAARQATDSRERRRVERERKIREGECLCKCICTNKRGGSIDDKPLCWPCWAGSQRLGLRMHIKERKRLAFRIWIEQRVRDITGNPDEQIQEGCCHGKAGGLHELKDDCCLSKYNRRFTIGEDGALVEVKEVAP